MLQKNLESELIILRRTHEISNDAKRLRTLDKQATQLRFMQAFTRHLKTVKREVAEKHFTEEEDCYKLVHVKWKKTDHCLEAVLLQAKQL